MDGGIELTQTNGKTWKDSQSLRTGSTPPTGLPPVPDFFVGNEVSPEIRNLASFNYTHLNFWGNFKIALDYVITDTKKQKRSFVIGVVTVFLVVCFLSLIQNALDRSGVIFVKLAEDQVGQYDILMTPASNNQTNSPFLNFTSLNASLFTVSSLAGVAPRWLLLADVYNPLFPNVSSSSIVLVFDSELESKIGLGTGWTHRPLGMNEMHLTASTVRKLGLKPQAGSRGSIRIDPLSLLNSLAGDAAPGATSISGLLSSLILSATPDLNMTQLIANLTTNVEDLPSNATLSLGNNTFTFNIWNLLGVNRTSLAQNLNKLGPDASLADVIGLVINNNTLPPGTFVYDQQYTLIDSIDLPSGKYPALLGNVVVLEKQFFERAAKDFVMTVLSNPVVSVLFPQFGIDIAAIEDVVTKFKLEEYAFSVVAMLKDRFQLYMKPTTERQSRLIEITDQISLAIGLDYPATWTTPVESGVETTNFVSLFLNEIFFSVIGVLCILAVMLIYSLLLSDVEEKTFEYGMLRTLGMPKKVLILLLCVQAFYFAAPGIVLGFLMCFILYVPIDFAVSWFVVISMEAVIHSPAIALGLLLGTILPFLGMLLPIRKALSRTLRDALDIYHNTAYDSIVKIQKLENLGVSITESLVAVLLVFLGFVVYYLVPLSFLFDNLPMFLRILTLILLGMVIGQVLLTQALDYYLEKFFVWCLMWGPDRKLIHIVIKNLAGHRTRNKKTSTMFTLCLGFVVFAATMFVLQAKSIPQNLKWIYGSDVGAIAFQYDRPLPEDALRAYLNTTLVSNNYPAGSREARDAIVVGFTFTTFPLQRDRIMLRTELSAASSIRSRSVSVQGVEENFLQVAFDEYLIVGKLDDSVTFPRTPNNAPDVTKALFLKQNDPEPPSVFPEPLVVRPVSPGTQRDDDAEYRNQTRDLYSSIFPVAISYSLLDGAYVDIGTKMQLAVTYKQYLADGSYSSHQLFELVKPLAMLKKIPSFTGFNSFQRNNSPLLLTMDRYQALLQMVHAQGNNTQIPTPKTPPKMTLLVRVLENATAIQIEGLVNGINSFIKNTDGQVINVRDQVAQTALASSLIMLFFDVVAVVGLIFSFFVLWLSFTANVRENSWEYGVLRAVGLTATTVGRLYIYEAMALVSSTIVLGSFLGIFTAVVLTLQINLFSELPFVFNFPTELFVLVVVLSLIVSVIGSYLPAEEFRQKEIAIALRG